MRRIQGKLQNVMERMDHGMHVFRTYCRNSFLKQYEKAATFLRLELVCNRVQDFKLKKSLRHWELLRRKFQEVTDRFWWFERPTAWSIPTLLLFRRQGR